MERLTICTNTTTKEKSVWSLYWHSHRGSFHGYKHPTVLIKHLLAHGIKISSLIVFLMPWLIYRTEEPPSLIQVILTLDTASLWAGHPLQRQHWETSGRHRSSIVTFWHAQPWVRVWGYGESIRRNTLPQEVGMASTLNERKLRQGARITFLKRRVRAWRGDWMASLNNAVPFNTDLEYSGPQIIQSASTLFLILTHNWFPPLIFL